MRGSGVVIEGDLDRLLGAGIYTVKTFDALLHIHPFQVGAQTDRAILGAGAAILAGIKLHLGNKAAVSG